MERAAGQVRNLFTPVLRPELVPRKRIQQIGKGKAVLCLGLDGCVSPKTFTARTADDDERVLDSGAKHLCVLVENVDAGFAQHAKTLAQRQGRDLLGTQLCTSMHLRRDLQRPSRELDARKSATYLQQERLRWLRCRPSDRETSARNSSESSSLTGLGSVRSGSAGLKGEQDVVLFLPSS